MVCDVTLCMTAGFVSLQENASLFIDTSKLPFLKYTMSEKEFNRFTQGKCTTEERKKVLKIYETVLPRRREQVAMMAECKQKMEDVSLRGNMASRYEQTEEEVLDSIRERVCQFYSIVRVVPFLLLVWSPVKESRFVGHLFYPTFYDMQEESEYEKHKRVALETIHSSKTTEKIDWKDEQEKMMKDPSLAGKALSLKMNPSMSDAARKQIAKVLLDYC